MRPARCVRKCVQKGKLALPQAGKASKLRPNMAKSCSSSRDRPVNVMPRKATWVDGRGSRPALSLVRHISARKTRRSPTAEVLHIEANCAFLQFPRVVPLTIPARAPSASANRGAHPPHTDEHHGSQEKRCCSFLSALK